MRTQRKMHLSHIAHVRTAYFTHMAGIILCAMAIELLNMLLQFRDRLHMLIDRAHEQLPRPLETKWRCIHLGSASRRPFDTHLHIHHPLQLLIHPRLELISTTKS